METHIIVGLSLTLLILLFVIWRDRRERLEKALEPLQTQIVELKNLVKALPQDNQIDALVKRFRQEIKVLADLVRALPEDSWGDAQIDVFAERLRWQINVLADIARQADELRLEIILLEGRRRPPTPIAFKKPPPELPQENAYWQDLSRWIREEKQWTCEKCCINLENRWQDLHVHHIWGRGFNSPQHLKVLCRGCHADEPGHAFMKANPEYDAFLRWRDGQN